MYRFYSPSMCIKYSNVLEDCHKKNLHHMIKADKSLLGQGNITIKKLTENNKKVVNRRSR